jgi:hypothetical protein
MFLPDINLSGKCAWLPKDNKDTPDLSFVDAQVSVCIAHLYVLAPHTHT